MPPTLWYNFVKGVMHMTRGTTPTLTFQLPFDADRLTKLSIAFSQDGDVVLEKDLDDVTASKQEITLVLSEEDTLLLSSESSLYIQLRCGLGDDRMASDIIKTSVGAILKEGVL